MSNIEKTGRAKRAIETEPLTHSPRAALLEGYREMADDQEHEYEALEWCEALIGDATP